jgi:hypothetical protein
MIILLVDSVRRPRVAVALAEAQARRSVTNNLIKVRLIFMILYYEARLR